MATASGDRFKKLLSDLRQKYSLADLRVILKDEELGNAPGWDQLASRLEGSDSTLQSKAEQVLTRLHGDLILAGTKNVHIFELPQGAAEKIISELDLIEPSSPNFGATYPFPLSESALRGLTNEYELVAKTANSSGDVSLVFCARRTFEDRVHYDTNEVTAAVQAAFAGFDKFIAIRQVDFQVFDILTVRASLDRLEVLIDYPDRIQKPETTEDRCLALLGRAASAVPILTDVYARNSPLNLFACINNLYQSKSEGRVSRLYLRSPTDSIKKESMTSAKDLRTEKFHAAGVLAVGAVTPFDVTITWDSLINVKGKVDAQVGTSMTTLSSADPYVRTARISGARSDAAILAVVNKLVSYST
jgi:hypothetical protein